MFFKWLNPWRNLLNRFTNKGATSRSKREERGGATVANSQCVQEPSCLFGNEPFFWGEWIENHVRVGNKATGSTRPGYLNSEAVAPWTTQLASPEGGISSEDRSASVFGCLRPADRERVSAPLPRRAGLGCNFNHWHRDGAVRHQTVGRGCGGRGDQ